MLGVRVFASDDRDRDRLARVARWLLVRNPQDDRAGTTVLSAAEHEMLAMVAAARAGARVPEPVVAYPVAGGPGPPGALVAWIDVAARQLDHLTADQISEATLADLWRNVWLLQRHRLAHRQLRSDNVSVDDSGQVWLSGFALARARSHGPPAGHGRGRTARLAGGVDRRGAGRSVRGGRPRRSGRDGRRCLRAAAGALRSHAGSRSGITTGFAPKTGHLDRPGGACVLGGVRTCWQTCVAQWRGSLARRRPSSNL